MAGNRLSPIYRPPKMAETLIGLSTPAHLRDPLLGDFAEEFWRLCQKHNKSQANKWYWQQALRSLPHLIPASIHSNAFLIGLAMVGIVYLLFRVWLNFAFGIFRRLYDSDIFHGSILAALSTRLSIELIGFLLAGAIIQFGLYIFRHRARMNNTWPLLLFATALILPSLITLSDAPKVMVIYSLARAVLAVPALFAGAKITQFFTRSQPNK